MRPKNKFVYLRYFQLSFCDYTKFDLIFISFSEPNDQRKVLVKKLALCVEGRDDMELDLTSDLSQLKKQVCRYSMLLHLIGVVSVATWYVYVNWEEVMIA